ncbi:glycosyltransferase family 2 protein [Streptomyces sp. NPDC093990]|uniref:glycosyltransferase family 2 protein n=1 Tax=Streptomyces sp. NPDC093990 TaxID=3155306 RepID=UPI003420A7D8
MPKLSVIVPFYNVQQYAPDTLRSLRLNARRDFEFVLVNDKSRDETPAILDRAAEELSDVAQVQVIHHETNGGLATARNTGLDAARGEYLTFLDGDDWLAPGYLPELLAAIEGLGCDFVRTDHVQTVARARTVHRVPIGRRGEVMNPREAILPADRSTSVDYAYAWAGAYHRRLLDRGLLHFTDGLRTAEDRPWIWKLHREAESFAVVSLLGVFYRRGVASSLTQIGDARQLDFIRAFDQVVEETAADRDADRLLPKAVRTYCAIIAHHLSDESKWEPSVAKQLRAMSAAAIKRMPQDMLGDVLDTMDLHRSAKLRRLRRLRRRVTTAKAAA